MKTFMNVNSISQRISRQSRCSQSWSISCAIEKDTFVKDTDRNV